MTTTEDNQQEVTALTPQEKPHNVPAEPSNTAAHQAEQEITATQAEKIGQPTPPRVPGTPVKTRVLPERQTSDTPLLPAPEALADPAARLADLNWMPPAEDQVARFLSDVADIAPPPTRGREGSRVPNFMVPGTTSPEAVKRKKARAEPFWSEVVATPMEHPTLPPEPHGSHRGGSKRSRRLLRWLIVVGVIVLLAIGGLAALVLTHHLRLPGLG